MKHNPFSVLDTKVSRLGYGCMRFPTTEGDKINKKEARKLIEYAYQNGITYFDTAWAYHEEESQGFVGEVLSQYPRDSFYLATKMPPWKLKENLTKEYIFEEQLKRCQVDYFDYYLMHAMSRENYCLMREHKVYEYLAEKKRQGIIKHLGFSFHGDLMTLENLLENYEWDFVQLQYNYFDDTYAMMDTSKEYELVTRYELPIVVMEPVRGGFLANVPEDVRDYMKEYNPKVSPAAWALRWCLSRENVALVLSGMSDLSQVKENIETFQQAEPLTEADETMIAVSADMILAQDIVPCTACRYCMDCSFGVDIPEMFRLYNNYQLFERVDETKKGLEGLKEKDASYLACTHCEECVPLCPQNIDIPSELERIGPILDAVEDKKA